jgi:hypothetical protein
MKIFGVSLGTIIFVVLLLILGHKFGGSIPLIKNV